MSNFDNELQNLKDKLEQIKIENEELLKDVALSQLNDLLDGTGLAEETEPSIFNTFLDTYKQKSDKFEQDFFGKIQTIIDDISIDDNTKINDANQLLKISELQYLILKNNIEIVRTYINSERNFLQENITSIKNNEHFAKTLNSDYSEIFKYRYLRNWGIFLSLLGGAFFLRKMK
jgi:hypothetical protein